MLMVVAALGVTLISFVISHAVPADPIVSNLGQQASQRPEIVAAFKQRWGLDRPLYEQYFAFMGNLVRGDLGTSINTRREDEGTGAVRAIDPHTGERKWEFAMTDVTDSGILTTATDLLFTGSREGYFHALDARTGALLWKTSLGGQIDSGPMTFEIEGKQYVTVAAGHSLFTFALREAQ